MNEGKIQFNICGICGGQHNTESHLMFLNEKKEKKESENEQLNEIFLDIFGAKRQSQKKENLCMIESNEKLILNEKRIEQICQDIESIEEELKRLFPKSSETFQLARELDRRTSYLPTRNVEMKKFIDEGKYTDSVAAAHKVFKRLNSSYIHSSVEQADKLFRIASLMNEGSIDSVDIIAKIGEILKGKKVLIIGDDIGSLSGALNALGAKAYGLEFDEEKVEIAHSGLLAENNEPQNQVIAGDAWDLANQDTQLFKKVETLGPFDCIYSYSVYNDGSGFSESFVEKWHKRYDEEPWFKYLMGNEKILAKGGIQFGDDIESERMPWFIFDGLYDKVMNSSNKEILKKWEKLCKYVDANYLEFHNSLFKERRDIVRKCFIFNGKMLHEVVRQIEEIKKELSRELS